MSVQIKFCGAAGIVTGSCYLITVPEGKFLVDCGMYQGTKTVETKSYKGTVVVCSARWVPVSGHKRNKESVRYMQNNRALEAWLAPIPGTTLLVPYRVSVGTMRGTMVVEATDLKITGPTVTAVTTTAD